MELKPIKSHAQTQTDSEVRQLCAQEASRAKKIILGHLYETHRPLHNPAVAERERNIRRDPKASFGVRRTKNPRLIPHQAGPRETLDRQVPQCEQPLNRKMS